MTKRFTKGQEVYQISNWDGDGTYCIKHLIVESCGKVQMTASYKETGNMIERTIMMRMIDEPRCFMTVVAVDDCENPEELARQEATKYLADRRAAMEMQIEKNADDAGYVRVTKQNLDALHEPRAIYCSK